MAKLVLCHVAKLSKIKQMWHLQMICSKFAIEVNPFFRPVLLSKGKEDVPGELEKFPFLVEHDKRVLNVPEIMEWVTKLPVTEF